jgi:hypothetical protein
MKNGTQQDIIKLMKNRAMGFIPGEFDPGVFELIDKEREEKLLQRRLKKAMWEELH